jgi:hypothetical protein
LISIAGAPVESNTGAVRTSRKLTPFDVATVFAIVITSLSGSVLI